MAGRLRPVAPAAGRRTADLRLPEPRARRRRPGRRVTVGERARALRAPGALGGRRAQARGTRLPLAPLAAIQAGPLQTEARHLFGFLRSACDEVRRNRFNIASQSRTCPPRPINCVLPSVLQAASRRPWSPRRQSRVASPPRVRAMATARSRSPRGTCAGGVPAINRSSTPHVVKIKREPGYEARHAHRRRRAPAARDSWPYEYSIRTSLGLGSAAAFRLNVTPSTRKHAAMMSLSNASTIVAPAAPCSRPGDGALAEVRVADGHARWGPDGGSAQSPTEARSTRATLCFAVFFFTSPSSSTARHSRHDASTPLTEAVATQASTKRNCGRSPVGSEHAAKVRHCPDHPRAQVSEVPSLAASPCLPAPMGACRPCAW